MADAVVQHPAAAAGAAGPGAELEFDYEWKEILPGMAVPPSLEYQLSLGKAPTLARIAPKWQLQLWSEKADAFYRVEVARFQTIAAVKRLWSERAPASRCQCSETGERYGSGHAVWRCHASSRWRRRACFS